MNGGSLFFFFFFFFFFFVFSEASPSPSPSASSSSSSSSSSSFLPSPPLPAHPPVSFHRFSSRAIAPAVVPGSGSGTPSTRHRNSASTAPCSPASFLLRGAHIQMPRSNRSAASVSARVGGSASSSFAYFTGSCRFFCFSAMALARKVTSNTFRTWSASVVAIISRKMSTSRS